ncbi:HET-domain-containing protein [Parathielavia hyrcaniae]|uniref:HET-domain-containing protein n=1 Tax=Parathielavia hyrcaniae TaxID=113614 RepID=A0AAN6QCI9_9PEZI|nr:HET-domain-containing protein [Parathielavia hyrcaniae]
MLRVDVDPDKSEIVALVESKDWEGSTPGDARYLTLSHVWGEHTLIKLTRASLLSLKQGIPLSDLPLCFRDAVFLARRLKVHYLWIDSLCIIQDCPVDWARESAVMDQVYRHGVCNIAACDSRDATQSIFASRNPRVGEAIVFQQERLGCTLETMLIPDWTRLAWDKAPLYRRAWVLQEIWGELVREYSMCDLTHAGDKLVALAGLAKSFAPLIAEGYYCGIWGGRGLLRSLLWVCHERFDGRRPPAPMEYRAPSWSWASCDGRIGPNMTFSITTTVVEVESTHVLPKIAAYVYGQVASRPACS